MLAWFAGNHVAANLMMAVLLIGGGFVATSTKVMVFPDIDPRTITVTVPYPGATPVEVEESVCRRIEEAVAGVEGIKRLRSVSREGTGTVTAELEDDADDREVLDDVKSAVDQIQNFPPEDAEQPRVVDAERVNPVITIAIHGGGSEKTLRELAYRVRDDLGALEGVSKLKVDGARRYEIAVEVSERALREHKLRFEDVSRAVSLFSLNLPGGTIRTEGAEILLRTSGQAYRRLDFEGIVMRTRPDGTRLLLRDIATVVDAFEDVERLSLFNGQPAVFVEVSRVGDQRVLDVEGKVKEYVGTLALPTGVEATTWSNRADTLRSRMSLLLRNGLLGLVLVFGCLVLFMNLRLAFWTTMGIPISFLGAFLFLPAFDASINMISLFAFILVLGIVVDDAIVVGENIFSKREQGLPPLRAAVEGVREVLVPASVAVLTTIVAFLPLYFTPGFFGDILWVVPIVVIACLMVSLFEAAFILPSHLGTGSAKPPRGLLPLIQGGFRGALRWFVHAIYLPVLRLALRGRYVTVAIGLVTLALTGALVYGGVIKSVLFPRIDGENVSVSVRMANGTPAVETQRVLDHILAAAEQTRHDFDEDAADDAPSVFRNVAAVLGDNALSRGGGGPHGGGPEESGANVAEVKIELSPSEDRTAASSEIEAKWRKLIGEIPGATSVSFRSGLLAAGDDISVELAHADLARLLQATEALKGRIAE
ncbi:MAG: efflux RND transporter permease subunit, partial [Planctomycetota bacterium]|nr:efflux RND transporter permease subunit [Planctomycetota bacterium]